MRPIDLSYFEREARYYQNRAKAHYREAMWALDQLMNDPSNWYWERLAKDHQEKARFEAKEARHYLMLAINPDHYKAQTPFQD